MRTIIFFFVLFLCNSQSYASQNWANIVITPKANFEHTSLAKHKNFNIYQLTDGRFLLRATLASIDDFESQITGLHTNANVASFDSYLLNESSEWSYYAKENRLSPSERVFVKIQRLYVTNGDYEAMSQVMSRYKKNFTKNNVKRDMRVYVAVVGNDMPFIEIVRFARDKNDDVTFENGVNEAFGQALLKELSQQFGPFIRRGEAALEGTLVQ